MNWRSEMTMVLVFSLLGLGLGACNEVIEPERPGRADDSIVTVTDPACATLWAGQHMDAGEVCVSADEDNLYVDYATTGGWELVETHAWVGASLADMPHNAAGNPKIGLFPYASGDITGATSYGFAIPIVSLGGEEALCDTELFVVAHAALRKNDGSGGYQTETGWAGDDPIKQDGSWARFFKVSFTCDEPPPPEEGGECETAFAYGDTTFVDLGLTQKRWGWQLGPLDPGTYQSAIYAGAGQNDISKGIEVGSFSVHYDGTTVIATYTMAPGFVLEQTHLYAGTTDIDTIAPGQFGYLHDLSAATSDTFTVDGFNGDPVYLVAHAEVCPEGDGEPADIYSPPELY